MKKLILTILFCFLATASQANDGNMLYDAMKSKDPLASGIAEGYITGAYNLMIAQESFCPMELPHKMIIQAIGYFLQEAPEYRSEPAANIIYAVLHASWPCKEEDADVK